MANLYKISQAANNDYDTYDSAIVCALSEEQARHMYPGTDDGSLLTAYQCFAWTTPENVTVELIGKATKNIKVGVVLASFNAG